MSEICFLPMWVVGYQNSVKNGSNEAFFGPSNHITNKNLRIKKSEKTLFFF